VVAPVSLQPDKSECLEIKMYEYGMASGSMFISSFKTKVLQLVHKLFQQEGQTLGQTDSLPHTDMNLSFLIN